MRDRQHTHRRPGRLARFVQHPATNFVIGVALIVSGFGETVQDVRSGFDEGFRFGAHHGMVLFGLFQVLSAIANLLEGLQLSVKRDLDESSSG